jgi:hypothetical protein
LYCYVLHTTSLKKSLLVPAFYENQSKTLSTEKARFSGLSKHPRMLKHTPCFTSEGKTACL